MTALIEALRTPEDRFAQLPGYAFRPHYLDDLQGTGTAGDGGTAPANTRMSRAARDSRRRSLRPGVGQENRGSRRYRVRLGFASVRYWQSMAMPAVTKYVRC